MDYTGALSDLDATITADAATEEITIRITGDRGTSATHRFKPSREAWIGLVCVGLIIKRRDDREREERARRTR